MNTGLVVLVAAACLIGIVGTIAPIVPGALLVCTAVVVWSVAAGGKVGLVVGLAAIAVTLLAQVLKYLVPGRQLKNNRVPTRVLACGAIGGIGGLFTIPVVGLVLGFVVGVYLAEVYRNRGFAEAWPNTVLAMKAAGLSTLIEFASAVLVTGIWVSGVYTLMR